MTSSIQLNKAIASGQNNLDLIRLGAALAVLLSHCYPLTGSNFEPFSAYLGNYDTGGGFAVSAFFVISGFLITKSAESRNWTQFIASRALRILPGLAAVLLLQYLVIGPIFTQLPPKDYFSSGLTHLLGITVFNLQLNLPGTFLDLPSSAVNGSLWTLPFEVLFYALTAIFVSTKILRPSSAVPIALACLSAHVIATHNGYNYANPGPPIFVNIPLYHFTKLISFYSLGAATWYKREKVSLHPALALLTLLIFYLSRSSLTQIITYPLGLTYLIFFSGYYRKVNTKITTSWGDPSYGTYLYAFPIQQSLIQIFNNKLSPEIVAILATPITLILATLSWHYIEKPCIKLKSHFGERVSPIP